MEAQAAGRIHPFKVCVTAEAAVNPGSEVYSLRSETLPGQVIRVGIELVGNMSKLVGDVRGPFRNPAQFDRGHMHEGNRVPDRTA